MLCAEVQNPFLLWKGKPYTIRDSLNGSEVHVLDKRTLVATRRGRQCRAFGQYVSPIEAYANKGK